MCHGVSHQSESRYVYLTTLFQCQRVDMRVMREKFVMRTFSTYIYQRGQLRDFGVLGPPFMQAQILGSSQANVFTGNALARLQCVHKPVDLRNITFCTSGFQGPKYYWHLLQILRPRALFYRTDCSRRSKALKHALIQV